MEGNLELVRYSFVILNHIPVLKIDPNKHLDLGTSGLLVKNRKEGERGKEQYNWFLLCEVTKLFSNGYYLASPNLRMAL